VCIRYTSVCIVRYDMSSLALEGIGCTNVPSVCFRYTGVSSVCIEYASVPTVRYDISSLALECIADISVCIKSVY